MRAFFGLCCVTILLVALIGASCPESPGCSAENTEQITGAEYGLNTTSVTGDELAQSFQLVTAGTDLDSVRIKVMRTGSFESTDTLTLTVRNDSSATPTGSVVATSSAYIRTITTSSKGNWLQFSYTAFSLSASTTYWLRLSSSYAKSSANFVTWMASDSSDYFALGKAMYDSGLDVFSSDLFGPKKDFMFKVGC